MRSVELSPAAKTQGSFITETAADVASRRGEEILGLPVVKGKTWNVTVTISPGEAKQILLAMPGQRPLTQSDVLLYKRLILAGKFKQTHQGIAFDQHGHLLDGQHRLHACVEADAAIEVQCTFNLDRELFKYLDRGRNRSLTDDLITTARLTGRRESATVVAAAKIIANLDRGAVPWTSYSRGQFTVEDVDQVIGLYPQIVEVAEFCMKNRGRFRGLHTGVAAAFLTVFVGINRPKAMEFFNELMSGELLVAGDPAYELREYLDRRGAGDRAATMIAVVRCWNAHIEGRKLLKVFTEMKGSISFPEISKGKPPTSSR